MSNKKIDCVSEESRFLRDIINKSPEDIIEYINQHYDEYFINLPPGEYKKGLLTKITEHKSDTSDPHKDDKIDFSEAELQFLKTIHPLQTQKLVYCLMCQSKFNPHESGWVRLDWPKCLRFAFTPKETAKLRLEDLQACVPYGMDMRVIGSKNPILCFSIPLQPGPSAIQLGPSLENYNLLKSCLTTLPNHPHP